MRKCVYLLYIILCFCIASIYMHYFFLHPTVSSSQLHILHIARFYNPRVYDYFSGLGMTAYKCECQLSVLFMIPGILSFHWINLSHHNNIPI